MRELDKSSLALEGASRRLRSKETETMRINASQAEFSVADWTGHLFRSATTRSRRVGSLAGAWQQARDEVRRERAMAAIPRHLRDDVGVTSSHR